jgi:hypothetical protein
VLFPLAAPVILTMVVALLARVAAMRTVVWNPKPPINTANFDRDVASFDESKRWNFFRFRKADLDNLIRLLQLPHYLEIKGENNGFVTGTFAALVLFYRLQYPETLSDNLDEFGCNCTKLGKIFNSCLDFLYDLHHLKVLLNITWYSGRFDLYHEVNLLHEHLIIIQIY